MPRYFHDQPISNTTEDKLWGDKADIRKELSGIARTIARALTAPQSTFALTFAIYGRWGMGKSSALGIIRDEVVAIARKAAERAKTSAIEKEIEEATKARANAKTREDIDKAEARVKAAERAAQAFSLVKTARESAEARARAKTDDETAKELDLAAAEAVEKFETKEPDGAQLIAEAKDEAAQREEKVKSRLKFAHYNANRYEILYRQQKFRARASVGLEMLRGIAGGTDDQLLDLLAEQMPYFTMGENLGESTKRDQIGVQISIKLQRLIQTLSNVYDFDNILQQLLIGRTYSRDTSGALVVFVDDLDRCEIDYVWEVLTAVQQFSSIRNVFFILAVDPEHLRRAIRARPGGLESPDFALEKYIQHSITLPEVDEERMRRYLDGLLDGEEDEEDDGDGNAVIALLKDNVRLLVNGLTAQTPRSIKRFVNEIRPDISTIVTNAPSETERRRRIKARILRYTWPDFYFGFYLPSQEIVDKRFAFQTLETTCKNFAADRDERRLKFELERLSQQTSDLWADVVTPALARYLGQPPLFFGQTQDERPKATFYEQAQQHVAPTAEPDTREENVSRQPDSTPEQMRAQLRQLRLEVQAAKTLDEQLQHAQTAFELVERNPQIAAQIGRYTTAEMGDIAATFVSNEAPIDLSPLFEVSLRYTTPPEIFVNNAFRYIAWIVAREKIGLYERARELLNILDQPPYNTIRRDQMALLKIGLGLQMAKTDPSSAPTTDFTAVLDAFMQDPTDQRKFVTAMGALMQQKDYANLLPYARRRIEATSTADEAYNALRMAADGLAESDDEKDEFASMELYRFMLDYCICNSQEASDDEYAIRLNYGNMLYKADYDDEAGRHYYRAYEQRPNEPFIRNAYSNYLGRARRPDLALKVSRGERISEEVLIPAEKTIPTNFIDTDKWWMSIPHFQSRCS